MSWLDDIRAALGQAQAPLRSAAETVVQRGLQPALRTAGDVADTPGSILRGVGAGVGNQLRGDDGSGYLSRAVTGVLDPSQRVTGQEVNQNAGLGNSALGGVITNVLTDPIAMGAAAKLGAGGLGALGRNLGGDAASAARAAAPETFSAPGLTTMTRNANGAVSVGEVSPAVGGSTAAADGSTLFPQGNQALSTAAQWTGRPGAKLSTGAAPMINDLAPGATSQAGAGDLLNLRRNFTVLRDAGLDASNQPTFRAVGGLDGGAARARTVFDEGQNAISAAMRSQGNPLHGQYQPAAQTATVMQNAAPGTLRHETLHGLIDAARRSGDTSSLSMIPRLSANAQESSSPLLRGLGQIGEETAAYGAEARRPLDQLKNMWNFLDNPQQGYAAQFSRESPLAGALYRNAVVPNAVRGAGAGAAGVGSYLGGNALMGGN